MAIDKVVPVDLLVYTLWRLPEGCRVQVNDVRNLVVSDEQGHFIGFVDFSDGSYVPFRDDGSDIDDFNRLANTTSSRVM